MSDTKSLPTVEFSGRIGGSAVDPLDLLEPDDLLTMVLSHVGALQVIVGAPTAQASVRRAIERMGGDPSTDEDFQRMVANPVSHYSGGQPLVPTGYAWPSGAPPWDPRPDPQFHIDQVRMLIDRYARTL